MFVSQYAHILNSPQLRPPFNRGTWEQEPLSYQQKIIMQKNIHVQKRPTKQSKFSFDMGKVQKEEH